MKMKQDAIIQLRSHAMHGNEGNALHWFMTDIVTVNKQGKFYFLESIILFYFLIFFDSFLSARHPAKRLSGKASILWLGVISHFFFHHLLEQIGSVPNFLSVDTMVSF